MSSISHRIRRFLALDPERRRRFLVALGSLTMVAALLRSVGYRRSHSLLARRSRAPVSTRGTPGVSTRVELEAWAVRTASEQLPWGSCLPRSLTLWWLLQRRGIDCDIHFGVRKNDDDFGAHAWVEWNGRALTDSVDPRAAYTTLEGS